MSAVISAPVAVVDIGSNSIKILVARRREDGTIESLLNKTLETRISAGIAAAAPRLSEEGMARGVAAVVDLLARAAPFRPARVRLVATSAVRDAHNGAEFCERVCAAVGYPVELLSGEEEANLIGRGLVSDPALVDLRDFYHFDLGGGSLECLAFRDRSVVQAFSLQLGCVRLTERFVADPAAPLESGQVAEVVRYATEVLRHSGFRFDLLGRPEAVFTGGTLTAVRLIRGSRRGAKLGETSPVVTVAEVRELFSEIARLPLEERRELPGMPPGRADVLPVALATVLVVAETAGVDRFRHSLHNLRWGVAVRLLEEVDEAERGEGVAAGDV